MPPSGLSAETRGAMGAIYDQDPLAALSATERRLAALDRTALKTLWAKVVLLAQGHAVAAARPARLCDFARL